VLVLSEFAGAAAQLKSGALLVNPYDVEGMAKAIHTAIHMEEDERRKRMRKMRDNVRHQDVFWWVSRYMAAAEDETLEPFAESGEYLPEFDLP
jgi:trehalose 6-phosphate synthase